MESLSSAELRNIFTGREGSWSAFGGDGAIQILTRPEGSGSIAALEELVGCDEALVTGEGAPLTGGAAIGFGLWSECVLMGLADGYSIIAVDGVEPTEENIASGEYALGLDTLALVSSSAAADSGERALWLWLQGGVRPGVHILSGLHGGCAMKKRFIPLALALALLLTGCGLADQWNTVREEYIEPAIERADGAGTEPEDAVAAPNIGTDRELLTDYERFEAVYSRAGADTVSALTPSDSYGRLLPFEGGLVTESGRIVLDPVLADIQTASISSGPDTEYLAIYILQNTDGMYAVCGADGSWITGFDYVSVYPMELGVLCVTDEEANYAVCYGGDGAVVFDTANFSDRYMMAAGSVSSLARCEGGLMLCTYFRPAARASCASTAPRSTASKAARAISRTPCPSPRASRPSR